MLTLDQVEALIWSQMRNLSSNDELRRKTSMDVVRELIAAYAQDVAGPIVADRRQTLREVS